MVAALAGCAAQAPVPSDRFYRFADPEPGATGAGSPLMEHLEVGELRASGVYAERPLVYSTDEGRRRLEQYHYDFWLDAPARLLQRHLVAYFRSTGVAGQVSRRGPGSAEHPVVGGHIDCFEKHVAARTPQVVVCLELYLDRPGEDAPLFVKRYDASVTVDGKGMEADVQAYEQAIERILAAFLKDMARMESQENERNALTAAE